MKTSRSKIMSNTQISDKTKKLVEKIKKVKSNSTKKIIASDKVNRLGDFDFYAWLEHNPDESMRIAEFSTGLKEILNKFNIISEYKMGYNALGWDYYKLSSLIELQPVLKDYLTENIDQLLDVTYSFKRHIETQNEHTKKIMEVVNSAKNEESLKGSTTGKDQEIIRKIMRIIRYNSVIRGELLEDSVTGKDLFIPSMRDALNKDDIEGAQKKIYLHFSKSYEFADRENLKKDKESFCKLMRNDLQYFVTALGGSEAKLIKALITERDKLNGTIKGGLNQLIVIADNSKADNSRGKANKEIVKLLVIKQEEKNNAITAAISEDNVLEVVIRSIVQKYKTLLTKHLREYNRSKENKNLENFVNDFKEMTSSIPSALQGVGQEVYNKHIALAMKETLTGIYNTLVGEKSLKYAFCNFKNNFCTTVDKKLLAIENNKSSNNKNFNIIDMVNDLVQSLPTKLHTKVPFSEKYATKKFVDMVTKPTSVLGKLHL